MGNVMWYFFEDTGDIFAYLSYASFKQLLDSKNQENKAGTIENDRKI